MQHAACSMERAGCRCRLAPSAARLAAPRPRLGALTPAFSLPAPSAPGARAGRPGCARVAVHVRRGDHLRVRGRHQRAVPARPARQRETGDLHLRRRDLLPCIWAQLAGLFQGSFQSICCGFCRDWLSVGGVRGIELRLCVDVRDRLAGRHARPWRPGAELPGARLRRGARRQSGPGARVFKALIFKAPPNGR